MRRDVFQAIADPTRRAILGIIALQAMTPNAIADHFQTSRQAVSNHIKILTECELLEKEKLGREIYYHFKPQKLKVIADFIEPFEKLWNDRFDKLENLMKENKSKS